MKALRLPSSTKQKHDPAGIDADAGRSEFRVMDDESSTMEPAPPSTRTSRSSSNRSSTLHIARDNGIVRARGYSVDDRECTQSLLMEYMPFGDTGGVSDEYGG